MPEPINGEKGSDGVGLDAPIWANGIYRKGQIVQHNIGQYFEASADTADEPGTSESWSRIGKSGFRFCNGFKADRQYLDGDIYVKDYCTFMVANGEPRMIAKVGSKGDKGDPGKDADVELVAKSIIKNPDFEKKLEDVSNGVEDFVVSENGFVLSTKNGDQHIWKLPESLSSIIKSDSATDNKNPPIKRFSGDWDGGISYTRGDVVNYGQGAYVCYKSGKSDVIDEHFVNIFKTTIFLSPGSTNPEQSVENEQNVEICYNMLGKNLRVVTINKGFTYWLDGEKVADPVTIEWIEQGLKNVTADDVVSCNGGEGALDAAKAYTDEVAIATLGSANAHSDEQDAATAAEAKAYIDAAAIVILDSANAHSDTQDAATLQAAKDYADSVTPPAQGSSVKRVTEIPSSTSITLNLATTDIGFQKNTQASGTLTINAPTGTPVNEQRIEILLLSAAVQTFAWNAIFQGSSDLSLPANSTGSNKYDRLGFSWNADAGKWQLIAKVFGF